MTERLARPGRPAQDRALTNAVLDFRPSRHGLHFGNQFPSGPTMTFGPFDIRWLGLGDASRGLCGGMTFVVRDLFERQIDPPPDLEPPPNGSRRFRSLVRRQVQSLDWLRLALRFYDLAAFRPPPTADPGRATGRRPAAHVTLDDEWPRIRAEIDAGRLATVGLVREASANPLRLNRNHQVLAWGYRVGPDEVTLRLYDPNWPDRDDVEARIRLRDGRAADLESSTGEPLVGFFLAPFVPAEPRAWRRPVPKPGEAAQAGGA